MANRILVKELAGVRALDVGEMRAVTGGGWFSKLKKGLKKLGSAAKKVKNWIKDKVC